MDKFRKVTLWALLIMLALLLGLRVNHGMSLAREESLRVPLGQLVEVKGHNMSVYVEGQGDKTLVFLSGSGTCSPILISSPCSTC